MLNLFAIPKVSAVIKNNGRFSSAEALEFLTVNILDECRENVAKSSLSLSLLNLHQLEVNEDKRVILDIFSIARAVTKL